MFIRSIVRYWTKDMSNKTTIKPDSTILSAAVVGGAGLALPPDAGIPPPGMGAVLLYVPLEVIGGKNPGEMQADMGLPWAGPNGEPYWFPAN